MCPMTSYVSKLRNSFSPKLMLNSEVPQLNVAWSLVARRPIGEGDIAVHRQRSGNCLWIWASDGGQRRPVRARSNRCSGKQVWTWLSIAGAPMSSSAGIVDAVSSVNHEAAADIPREAQAWAHLRPPGVEGCIRCIHTELLPFRCIWIEERQAVVRLMK